MTSLDNLLAHILTAPDEEAAARVLVEAERARASDADPLRRPIDLPLARIVVRKLREGKPVRWS